MTLTFPSTGASPFSELLRLAFGGKRPEAKLIDRDRTIEAVHKSILEHPGLLITEIHKLLPSVSTRQINVAAARLKAAGDVRVEGTHHQFRYFPKGDK